MNIDIDNSIQSCLNELGANDIDLNYLLNHHPSKSLVFEVSKCISKLEFIINEMNSKAIELNCNDEIELFHKTLNYDLSDLQSKLSRVFTNHENMPESDKLLVGLLSRNHQIFLTLANLIKK